MLSSAARRKDHGPQHGPQGDGIDEVWQDMAPRLRPRPAQVADTLVYRRADAALNAGFPPHSGG